MKSPLEKAISRVARLLALRDRSRRELAAKLETDFDSEVVEAALNQAANRGWISHDEEVASRASEALARKYKSHRQIEAQLRSRGLKAGPVNVETEVEKIRTLVEKKFGSCKLTVEEKAKARRFLVYRGFEEQWIQKVIGNEEF